MTVYVGSASIDENGRAHGGRAGNQSGRELKRQAWYLHKKGWRVFRAKDLGTAARIARCMEMAIANRHVGYDQYERNSLYRAAEPYGFDVSKVREDCETDCSALVRVCCAYAGIMGLPAEFRTANEPRNLLATGRFDELVGSKYTAGSAYLRAGDILCTATSGHTVVVLNDGPRTEPVAPTEPTAPTAPVAPTTSEGAPPTLCRGSSGEDVRSLQRLLDALGYDLGPWGVDGDFGPDTAAAVRRFQEDHELEASGVCDRLTLAALEMATAAAESESLIRFSGDCYVRSEPGTHGRVLGVAKRGSELPYGGQTADNGWLLARYREGLGWVSGKYGRLVN